MEYYKSVIIRRILREIPTETKPSEFYSRKSVKIDEAISVLSATYVFSLVCPLSLKRQDLPVRTQGCTHVETFDLYSFLQAMSWTRLLTSGKHQRFPTKDRTNPKDVSHKCPICTQSGALYIDAVVLTNFITSVFFLWCDKIYTACGFLGTTIVLIKDPISKFIYFHFHNCRILSKCIYGASNRSFLSTFRSKTRRFSFGDGAAQHFHRRYRRLSTLIWRLRVPRRMFS